MEIKIKAIVTTDNAKISRYKDLRSFIVNLGNENFCKNIYFDENYLSIWNLFVDTLINIS